MVLWFIQPAAAVVGGPTGWLVVTIVALRRTPPVWSWPVATFLGGVLAACLVWTLYGASPILVRLHNTGDRPISAVLILQSGYQDIAYTRLRLAPGRAGWGLVPGHKDSAVWLSCNDGSGPQRLNIAGYVTNTEILFEGVKTNACRSIDTKERRF